MTYSQDYLDGYAKAKTDIENILRVDIAAANKELKYRLSPSVKERTLVRHKYAQKHASSVHKLLP